MNYYGNNDYRDYLAHYGVLGMHWGIRRYQPYSVKPRGSGKIGKEIGEAKKGTDKYSAKLNKLGQKKTRLETKRDTQQKQIEALKKPIDKKQIIEMSRKKDLLERKVKDRTRKNTNPGFIRRHLEPTMFRDIREIKNRFDLKKIDKIESRLYYHKRKMQSLTISKLKTEVKIDRIEKKMKRIRAKMSDIKIKDLDNIIEEQREEHN